MPSASLVNFWEPRPVMPRSSTSGANISEMSTLLSLKPVRVL